MSVAAEIEREYKFDVDAEFDPPDLRPVVGRTVRLAEVEQRSTYFDTADHRLWARGITFRHRRVLSGDGADRSVGTWTLKLPTDAEPPAGAGGPTGSAGAGGSGGPTGSAGAGGPEADSPSARSELSWSGPLEAVPEGAGRILAGIVRRAPLSSVAELSALRRRMLLQHPDADGPWAEIDDDLVSVTAGPNAGHRFRQIELELNPGAEPPPGELEAVLGRLRAAGALPGGGSKLGTALGLAAVPPALPRSSRSSSRAVVGDVVRQVLAGDLAAVLEYDYRLRRCAEDGTEPDPELIHRARVAARRVRAHLRTLGPVLDPVWARHVKDEVQAFGLALGRVRDADVLIDHLRAHDEPDDRDGVEELVRLVSADRALAASELTTHMTATAYVNLLDRLNAAAASPPLYRPGQNRPGAMPAGATLRRLVAKRWRKLASDLAALPDEPSPEELHHVRVRAKRLRYAAEAAAPYVGKKADRTRKAAKELQDVLGQIHDATTTVSWLRQLASHPSLTPADAFVAGRIAGRAEASIPDLCSAWPPAAKRLTGKKARGWLK